MVKNISREGVSEAEESLLSKGQKFSPVELDPPMIRMQKELNRFFRLIRIKWAFREKTDSRSEIEKKFYEKSDWEPPSASKELENFISSIQTKFDKWTPPRFIKDNITREERNFIKNLDEEMVYMVEDKGPSFTKMTKTQYLQAGEKELENPRFYEPIEDDICKELKAKSDKRVDEMFLR